MTNRSIAFLLLFSACALAGCSRSAPSKNAEIGPPTTAVEHTQASPQPEPSPIIPNLQTELLDGIHATTASPIGAFDFKNYTYELPRGWQNPDGTAEITLKNGRATPVSKDITDEMSDEAKADLKSQRRIGMSFVTAKFFDMTGDGDDEAIVILKVETGGAAIPQLVYVFTWKDSQPELIWPFRTGDRADGGLKTIYPEDGHVVVELYGQDRFILGQTETGKITDDVEQLCCPTFFTRSVYKWNGRNFLMQGKRLTYSVAEPSAPPVENLGDKMNNPQKGNAKR